MTSYYQARILRNLSAADAEGVDPRHIEAWMRVEHPTLDALSPVAFAAEVRIALACVRLCSQLGAGVAEDLALSFGL